MQTKIAETSLWALSVIALSLSSMAKAAIVSVSGNALSQSIVGVSLAQGAFETSGLVVGFDEQQGVSVASGNVQVDYLFNPSDVGTQFTGVDTPVSSQTLAAGTYDSHILHFDPVDNGAFQSVNNATFTFDQAIVAVIANQTFLNLSDALFGAATNYAVDLGRRFESHDLFTLVTATSLRIDSTEIGSVAIDQLRVITQSAVVSTPVTGALVLWMVVFLGIKRRFWSR